MKEYIEREAAIKAILDSRPAGLLTTYETERALDNLSNAATVTAADILKEIAIEEADRNLGTTGAKGTT
ncbi:MAG: hypothetical protein PHY64_00875 [Eubacteriales bacterium]|nr:hypothetical protein [Eubacteriales bacterium]